MKDIILGKTNYAKVVTIDVCLVNVPNKPFNHIPFFVALIIAIYSTLVMDKGIVG
jgi:hypothetical protein